MSEYMEKFFVSRLIGAPPVMWDMKKADSWRKGPSKPYSVILLDEIEKAHPWYLQHMFAVLDDGPPTVWDLRWISKTLIIMTSNIGARRLKDFGDGVGFTTAARMENADDNNKAVIEKGSNVHSVLSFLNRIDDGGVQFTFKEEYIFEILIFAHEVMKRLTTWFHTWTLSPEAKDFNQTKDTFSSLVQRPLQSHSKYLEDTLWGDFKAWILKKNSSDVLVAELDKETEG